MDNETKKYWQENIEAFGKFYDKQSEEKIAAWEPLGSLYKAFIFPKERKVTLDRYRKTVNFIEKNIKPGMTVIDLGCGTGVFTTEILRAGARAIALDYAEAAINATRRKVEENLPALKDDVTYLLSDVMKEPLPKSDLVIAIGVTPYIDSLETFLANILPTTNRFYCLFLDDKNWMNRVRRYFRFLNVRKYRFFDKGLLDEIPQEYGFRRVSRENVGTCFLDHYERQK